MLQAVYGFSLLEVVNYLEHYGLLRQKRDDGRYERCRPEHSWNSDNVSSNVLLYHLQRHSDHHAHPLRRFQALRHFDEAPELPSGYGTMILIALFPPVWRRVMDHRVLEHYDGDVTRANILPARRERILRRFEARRVSVYVCPECEYAYDEEAGDPREGFPAGTPWSRGARRLGVPRLRRARQGRLRARRGLNGRRLSQPPRASCCATRCWTRCAS